MLNNRYEVEIQSDLQTFEFVSSGNRGNVLKTVQYSEINVKGIYNLGFGDKNPDTGHISDVIVTNNGDSQKVLATVAATLYLFTDMHPEAIIIASGTTEARTRLYRIGITNNLAAIENDFAVFGLIESNWEPFRKSITYEAFLVQRKSLNL